MRGAPPLLVPLAALVVVGHLAFCAGVAWLLAAAGAFLRDLGDVIGPMLTMWLFVSPILYPASNLEVLGWLRFLNPLSPHIAVVRSILFDGRLPDLLTFGGSIAIGGLTAFAGWWVFRTAQHVFADVV